MTPMHASTLCRRELALLEGTVLHTYNDATGTPTIGCGHTAAAGAPVPTPGLTITAAQSDAIVAADLSRVYEPAIDRLVKIALTQYEFDALDLLTYNIGEGNFSKSALLASLNRGDKAGAADGFSHFTTSHGRQLPGLVKRREIERQIFTSGTYPGLKPAPGQSGIEMAASTTLGQGMRGDAVSHLQGELKLLGYFSGGTDGIFGPMTLHAVQAFQRAHGLSDDGVAGLKTGLALTAAIAAKAKLAAAVPTGPKAAAGSAAARTSIWARIVSLFTSKA